MKEGQHTIAVLLNFSILSFNDNELFILKVILNDNFSSTVRNSHENLQVIINLKRLTTRKQK